MYLCQRRHFFRIVGDESRLDVSTFAEFSEDFIDQFAFAHCVVNLHIEFLANFSYLFFVHACQIIAGVFLDRVQHGDTFVRGFEVNDVVAYFYLSGAVYIQTDFFNHFFCKFHHPVIVLVGNIYFHAGKFRIVRAVHSFVTEVLTYFIHSFETTYN